MSLVERNFRYFLGRNGSSVKAMDPDSSSTSAITSFFDQAEKSYSAAMQLSTFGSPFVNFRFPGSMTGYLHDAAWNLGQGPVGAV